MSTLPATFNKEFHDEELCRQMEYRVLGQTGMQVSKLSLGCGTLSNLYGELDVSEAIETVLKALKSGINYIDTAPYYGQGRSEEVLGMALRNVPRETFYIATKVGRYAKTYDGMFDFSAKRTRESVMRSLQLLGLSYIDVIQIHDIEFAEDLDIVVNECLPELEKLVKEGRAKYIGLTGYPLEPLKSCILKAPGRFDTVLSYSRYSLLDDSLLSYIDFFQKQGLGIICAAGHALGLLTNDGPQPWHIANDELKDICRKAARICEEANVELGKLAMYYCMQLTGASTFLAGMKSRQFLDINLNALHNGLTQKEQEVLQLLREKLFTKPLNWEGIELQRYWAEMKKEKL